MPSSFSEARKRQLARLDGGKRPTARAAIALAKSQAYQDAADAPATLRAYAADLANYEAWCQRHGFTAMPATPEVVGAYLESIRIPGVSCRRGLSGLDRIVVR